TYEREVPREIARNPEGVEINKASLAEFVMTDTAVAELDQRISAETGIQLASELSDQIESYVRKLVFFGIPSIAELRRQLSSNADTIVRFATTFLVSFAPTLKRSPFPRGISAFYLCYVLATETLDLDRVMKYLLKTGLARSEDHA